MLHIFRTNRIVAVLLIGLFSLSGCAKKPEVTTPHPAEKPRIVSLAPSITEMLFAIGAGEQLVGRTSACDWPAAASKVPVVGAFGRPSLELLATIHPDLVIDVDLAEKEMGKKISALGLKRATLSCKTPDDIPQTLRTLGKLTGHTREADSLALSITNGLAAFRQKIGNQKSKPSVYLEIWNDPFWTGGKGSYTSALIACAGGYNIGDVVQKEYFEISQEWVIQKNPDVIACMYMAKKSTAAGEVMSRPGWANISAVKQKRVYDHFDNSLFLRPGPRVLEGVEQLYRTIHEGEKPTP